MSHMANQGEGNGLVALHEVVQHSLNHDVAGTKAILTLDVRGMIRECNPAAEQLFKYPHHALVWRSITQLIPGLTGVTLLDGDALNSRLRFLCRIGHQFQAISSEGDAFACELFLNLLDGDAHGKLAIIVCPVGDLNEYSARTRWVG
jgi:PAS domain-containing protein